MITKVLNLVGVHKLSREEQQSLNGGDSFIIWTVHCHDGTDYNLDPVNGVSNADIVALCDDHGGYCGQSVETIRE